MIDENQLNDLKKKLYRLHFLLTNSENEITIRETLDHFLDCFKDIMSELAGFITSEYAHKPETNNHIIDLSFEHKLFNKEMTEQLKRMVDDSEKLESAENSEEIYIKIKEKYAGNLQMIYDMLSRMGQDAEEE